MVKKSYNNGILITHLSLIVSKKVFKLPERPPHPNTFLNNKKLAFITKK